MREVKHPVGVCGKMVEDKNIKRDLIIVTLLTLACLLPFSGKAFNIDDPLFLWTARQIGQNLFDFYGFDVLWYHKSLPMSEVMKNPPLGSYFIAALGSVLGYTERALHLVFLLPALATSIGTYFIAIRFTEKPLLATLASLFTPLFIVSGTTVMCDMLLLAFWSWAIVFWLKGSEKGEPLYMALSCVMIALGVMTKYFAISLIPLLVVYSISLKHPMRRYLPYLIIPVAVMVFYQLGTEGLYGRGLLLDAAAYARGARAKAGTGFVMRGFLGFVFTGGCVAVGFFFMPLLVQKKNLILYALGIIVLGAVLFWVGDIDGAGFKGESGVRFDLLAHFILFAITGFFLLSLALGDLLKNRDATSLFLFLWVFGTFVFAAFFNWTMNARSILPLAPAVGILLIRRFDRLYEERVTLLKYLPLIPALILSLMVAWADFDHAGSMRTAAEDITEKYSKNTNTIWFQGHWGFQYYMEKRGARALNIKRSPVKGGDILVMPLNNTNLSMLPPRRTVSLGLLKYPAGRWLTTMNKYTFAGFYASDWGALPYAFGPSIDEGYIITGALEPLWPH